MKQIHVALAATIVTVAWMARAADELKPLDIKLPKPVAVPTPKKLDKSIEVPTSRPVLVAPAGCVNLALKRPVDSSDRNPTIGELSLVTDGDKEAIEGSYVELAPGPQWVQIDLGKSCEIWGVGIWHNHAHWRAYHDVVVQISGDKDFIKGVELIFNNDKDGSAGQGVGKDREYVETYFGKIVQAQGAKARFVRVWSNGSTEDDLNHYLEVEVYGK